MSCNNNCRKKHIPEPGRGFTVCDCNEELCVEPVEGCYKLHETPWLEEYPDNIPTDIFEVRFKNTRRSYYKNVNNLPLKRGDIVAVEASPGHDIGIISLTGDMVAKQIRRTGFTPFNGEYKKIYRKAKPYDIERWQEAIAMEHDTMIQSRQIAAEMGLDMKIGDVEYQGDKIKAIFYYIADERVDFRELIKVFAEQFHIRVEMKQIGARQEAGRIGGLGSCGRQLCCASWMSSFVSVTTGAARNQDLSLNPQKLAGQCSKLKCCLVYELDSYIDARKDFPRLNGPLQTMDADYYHVKSDILAHTMSFSTEPHSLVGMKTISVRRVREIMRLNAEGRKPDQLLSENALNNMVEEPEFVNVIGEDSISRFDNKRRKKKRGGKGGKKQNDNQHNAQHNDKGEHKSQQGGEQKHNNAGEQKHQNGGEQKSEQRGEQRQRNNNRGRNDRNRQQRPDRGEQKPQQGEQKPQQGGEQQSAKPAEGQRQEKKHYHNNHNRRHNNKQGGGKGGEQNKPKAE